MLLLDSLSIFNAQPGATLLLSPDWVIVGASDDYLAATLTERAIIVGQHIFDAFPDNPATPEANAVANVRASLETVLATKQPHEMAPQHYDVPDRTRPGQFIERHWQPRHTPVLDAQGQVQCIIQSVQDITASGQAERQLRESQAAEQVARAEVEVQRQRFYEVLMALPALVATYHGPHHVYTFVNEAYRSYFPTQALPGRSLREVLPETEALGVLAVMDRVYQTGEASYQQELEVWLDFEGNGQPRQLFLNLLFHPLRDAQGRVDGLLDFSYDVTEQVLARQQVEQLNAELEARVQARTQQLEAALHGAEHQGQQLRLLTDALPVLIGYLDRERRYQFNNEAYRTWFNQDPAALHGQRVRDIVGEQAYAATAGYMDRALAGERLDFEATMPYRDGFSKHIRTSYVPDVRAEQVVGFYTLVQDVTEQVEAHRQVAALNKQLLATNDELGQANQQLTRTNVELDTFVYTASHDLKAPISNIESITLALRDTLPAEVQQDEMIAHLLELLEHTTTRFQRTIGQLTDLSKLQLAHAGTAEPVPLAAVIESVRLDLAPAIGEANAQLTVAVAPDLRVSFSPANLRSAIYNLLSNAVKYRALDRPAQVQVRAFPAGGRVVLEVQDNGLGLNAHQQSRLFGLFQRLHTHVEGTGVGLYTTKRLVENGGGTIAVESQADEGTTFTLTFPA